MGFDWLSPDSSIQWKYKCITVSVPLTFYVLFGFALDQAFNDNFVEGFFPQQA